LIPFFSSSIVTVDADGYLVMQSNEGASRWRQVEPLVFAEVDGKRQLVFRENERGEVTDLCTSPICVIAMLKQPWVHGRNAQIVSFALCLAILFAGVVGFPIAAVLQRRFPKPIAAKAARLLAWVTSAAFVGGAAATSAGIGDIGGTILFGVVAPALAIGLGLFVLGALLAAVLAGLTVLAWRRRWWQVAGRVCVTLVCAAAVGAAVWLYQWNLLGWNY
jgi:hypothetical protein